MSSRCPIPGGRKTKWTVAIIFLFFLIKGLAWLAIIFFGIKLL